jgi:hypothetical protein
MTPTIEWKKRRLRDTTAVAERFITESRDGSYRVVESRPVFSGLSVVFYAMVRGQRGWDLISAHKRFSAAQKACEQHNH